MIEFVPVSEGSRDLIKELSGVSDDPIVHAWNDQKIEKMLLKDLVQWLQQTVDHSDKTRLLLEDLRASLLQDLHEAPLNPDTYCKQNEIKLICLCFDFLVHNIEILKLMFKKI